MIKTEPFDLKFRTFQLLNDFLEEFLEAQGLQLLYMPGLPKRQLTAAAADCVHNWARKIPEELQKLNG